ncbi:uncharacterized protein [Onthophagus taurus]|uniref:uncharacterized protein n=1 Tax=Onthophagus taurus TaxID=166361 RepID=UPI000C20F3DF|nr:uncharacterized protein LOC111423742 [Onthophagus taurus]
MDKTKRGGKQRTVTSKGSKTKVDVHKHFDPVLRSRSRKSLMLDDFPELILDYKTSGKSTVSTTQKGLKKSISPSNYYKIEIDTAKRGVSLDRKSYKTPSTSSTSSYSLSNKYNNYNEKATKNKSNIKGSQQKPISKGTGPKPMMTSSNANNKIPNLQNKNNEIKNKPNNINIKLSYSSPKSVSPKPPNSPHKSCSPYTSQDLFAYSKDPTVERLKDEIITSAKICNCEVRQTVSELKEEIAKYRKTLHKNVNFLHNRNKVNDKCKECSVQTEISPQQRKNKLIGDDDKFQDLVSRIADLIGNENETNSRPPRNMASASTETDRPIRVDQQTQMNEKKIEQSEQQTETAGLKTQDQSVDNPKKSLDLLLVDKSMEFDYLDQQKENLSKVDELIDKAEQSLKALKNEFYQNTDLAPPPSPQLAARCCIDEILEQPLIQFSCSSIEKSECSSQLNLPEKVTPKVLLDCGTSMSNEKVVSKDQMVQCCPLPVMVNAEVNTDPQRPEKDYIRKAEDAGILFLSNQSKSLDCSEYDILPKDEDNFCGLIKSIGNQTDTDCNTESDCTCPLNSELKELEEDKSLDDISENFNDFHLNTISERTEIEESEKIIHNVVNKKESKLKVQNMPKIDIRPSLTMQTLCKINIKPSGSFELNTPKNTNVGYQEVKHNTIKDIAKSNKQSGRSDTPNLSLSQTVTMHLNQEINGKNKSSDRTSPSKSKNVTPCRSRSPSPLKCKVSTNPSSPSCSKTNSTNSCKNQILSASPCRSRSSSPLKCENKITYLNEFFTHTPDDSDNEFVSSISMKPGNSRQSCICGLIPNDIVRNTSEDSSASKSKSMPIKQDEPVEIAKGSNSETKSRNSNFIPPPIVKEINQKLYLKEDQNLIDTKTSVDESLKTSIRKRSTSSDEGTKKKLSFEEDLLKLLEPLTILDQKIRSPETTHINLDEELLKLKLKSKIDAEERNILVSTTTQTDDIIDKNVSTPKDDLTNTLNNELSPNKSEESTESEYVLGRDVATQVSQEDSIKTIKLNEIKHSPQILPQLKTKKPNTINNEIKERYYLENDTPCCINKPLPKLHKSKPYHNQNSSKIVPSGDSLTLPQNHYSKWFEENGCKATLERTTSQIPRDCNQKGFKSIPACNSAILSQQHHSDWVEEKGYKTASERTMSSNTNTCNRRLKKSPKLTTDSSCTISDDRSLLEESVSDGEIRCKCSVSIGELHLCRYANDIKSKCIYKKYPERIVKPQSIVNETVFYDNWIAYYTSSSGSSGEEPGCYSRKNNV